MDGKIFILESFDAEEFFNSAENYLQSQEDMPVLFAQSGAKFEHDRMPVEVCFYDRLLRRVLKNQRKYRKDIDDILLYGYIGRSRSGKNGIVALDSSMNSRDKGLRNVVQRFVSDKYADFCKALDFTQDPKKLTPIKVVTHRVTGERMVGVLDKDKMEAVLYDVKSYKP